ncbi:MAG: hypothetical protein VYE73_13710 [Acidobacteriota bacterium]|nr:hypothetical protein [Acidobacteriota bacterium]
MRTRTHRISALLFLLACLTPLHALADEWIEIALGGKREIVHIACLDTPESNHKFTTLGWFGRATTSALEIEYKLGTKICVAEQTPPRVDGDGHRIVYVQHNDGRDYANAVISEGFGLLRPANCRRGEHYRAAEDYSIKYQRVLWGRSGAEPAFAAANDTMAPAAGPGLGRGTGRPRRSSGGG